MTAQFKRSFREIEVFLQFSGICRTISSVGLFCSLGVEKVSSQTGEGLPNPLEEELRTQVPCILSSQRLEQVKNVKNNLHAFQHF